MKQIELKINRTFIYNILISIIVTFILTILIFQLSDYYIENNPLSQFGPIYKDQNLDINYELGRTINSVHDYPTTFEILLLQIKILFSGRYNTLISIVIFNLSLSSIYFFKYFRVKIV